MTPFITQLAFSDLAAKRESAWQTGVRTALFKQEKKSYDAQHIHFRGAHGEKLALAFFFKEPSINQQ